nr:EF-hand domain-containing protein [Lysobacter sp. CAU 1642]
MRAGFDHLDRNGNGRIDDDELPAGARRSVSRERRGHEQAVRRAFHRLDTDGNGWLDIRELTSPPR